jgi:hypothetical protein
MLKPGVGDCGSRPLGWGTTSLGYDVAEALIRRSAGADRIRGLRGVQAGQL